MDEKKKINYFDKFTDYLFGNKIIAFCILLYFIIVGLGSFLDGFGKICQGYVNTITFFENIGRGPLDDNSLINESDQLAKDIVVFLGDRESKQPQDQFIANVYSGNAASATIAYEKDYRAYQEETINLYKINYGQKVARYRAEFEKRKLTIQRLDNFYSDPVNTYMIGAIASDLATLSFQLRDRPAVSSTL